MHRPALLPLLIASLCSGAFAAAAGESATPSPHERVDAPQRWTCTSAGGARTRQQQVTNDLLPNVVFVGDSKPETLDARMARYKVPAVSAAVIRDGQLDWSAAWGNLQIDGARADCSTLFQAGSIAKPVTVLAALRMQAQGRIDFDQDINSYLKTYQLPAGKQSKANPVTLRNLFAHTSGITPSGYDGYAQGEAIPGDVQIVRAEAPSNSRKVEVLAAPGAALVYSGGGYTVAEIALQDRFDAPFEQLMRDWVLAPVGMKQADYTVPLPAASHAITARGHQADGSSVAGGWRHHPEQAAAGLWASASDLAAFLVEIGKGYRGESKIFTQASIRELLATPFDGHSYGFRLIGEGEQQFITHYGGTVGYRAAMTLNLQSGNGAVFLSNGDGGQDLGREFFAAVARGYDWPMFREERVTRVRQPTRLLKSLTGAYEFPEQGPTVSVVYEHKALTLVFPNGDRYAMTPIEGAPREFIHAETGVRARFDGVDADLQMHLYGQIAKRRAAAVNEGHKGQP